MKFKIELKKARGFLLWQRLPGNGMALVNEASAMHGNARQRFGKNGNAWQKNATHGNAQQ
jgi:hypothetical protein